MKRALLLTAIPILLAVFPQQASAAAAIPARFEGKTIDLGDADGWGPAHACVVASQTTCFRTEGQLADYLAQTTARTVQTLVAAVTPPCGTPTRVYANTNRTGNVVAISTRLKWVDLSGYGFDNQTSSYKIGTCAATFAENKAGGGARVSAGANAQVNAMASGWNDRASSIYLA